MRRATGLFLTGAIGGFAALTKETLRAARQECKTSLASMRNRECRFAPSQGRWPIVPRRRHNHLLYNQLIACDIPQRRGNWRNGINGKLLRRCGGSIASVYCPGGRFTTLASVTYPSGGRQARSADMDIP